ncbi:MAG TPA: protein kinase family protein, partial [Ktedonobacteraceae bacterium]|nr:protein kinase family protein [Ktedonobacteraceae bacterium]
MSMTQTTTDVTPSGDPHCQYCGIKLPPQAMFCASCGERVIKKQATSLLQDNQDIAAHYRITSLVRRRPNVSLFLATDILQQRPVALRDIDISSLDNNGRITAATAVQREYDLLRRQHIPFIIPLIDVLHFQNHLYVVAGWPRVGTDWHIQHTASNGSNDGSHLHTLQDILQSGKGLPEENLALTWIEQLCQSLQEVHASGIVVADLDPQTIILNGDIYASELALMVSWLPHSLRTLFPRSSTITNTTNFTAPEVLLGRPEPRSDIYSLGALLYLLLTGTPPDEPMVRTQRRLRLPGELNARPGNSLDDFIMKALAIDVADRFSSADEMRDALTRLRIGGKKTIALKESPHKNKMNGSAGSSPNTFPAITEETLTEGTFGGKNDLTTEAAGDALDNEQRIETIVSTDTVLITPIPASNHADSQSSPPEVPATPTQQTLTTGGIIAETPFPVSVEMEEMEDEDFDIPEFASPPSNQNAGAQSIADTPGQRFKRRITGLIPAIPRSIAPKITQHAPMQNSNIPAPVKPSQIAPNSNNGDQPKSLQNTASSPSFFQQLQRLLLGEQKQATTAAAIVETPLRVQPNPHYQIRIQIMGRTEPVIALDSKNRAIA